VLVLVLVLVLVFVLVFVLVLVLVLETSPNGFAGLRTCTTKPLIDSQ
jgi:hypothetical protein